MRKAAVALVAVTFAVMGLVACQEADRNPAGVPVDAPAARTEGGTAVAAVGPAPVPGKPGPIPVPGRGGSGGTTTVPVPGAPPKGGPGGGGGGGGQTPGGQPTPVPTPTPAPNLVTVTFSSSDVPKNAGPANPWGVISTIPVSGVTGDLVDIRVAFKATVPNNSAFRIIRLLNPVTAPPTQRGGAALYFFQTDGALSGSNIGTNCSAYGGAATFDDDIGTGDLGGGTPPYTGIYFTDGDALTDVASLVFDPSGANGDWTLEFVMTQNSVATLDCWTLTLIYQVPN